MNSEFFTTLADYNCRTNRELMDLLSKLTTEQLERNLGGFFASIIVTANHILSADILWLSRFVHAMSEVKHLHSEIPDAGAWSFGATPWPELPAFREQRETVDHLLLRLVAEIPVNRLSGTMEYTGSKGDRNTKLVWIALLHVFNHQTHHRGQISLMLDNLDVHNDFSNLVWKFS